MSHSLWLCNAKANLQITLSIKTNNSALHNISRISDWLHNIKIWDPNLLRGASTSATRKVKKPVLDDTQSQPLDSILNQCNPHVHMIQLDINFPLYLGLAVASSFQNICCCQIQHQSSKIWEEIKKKLQTNTTWLRICQFFFFDSATNNTTGYVLKYQYNVAKHNF